MKAKAIKIFDLYSIFITKNTRTSQFIGKEGISKVLKIQEHSSTPLKRIVRTLAS